MKQIYLALLFIFSSITLSACTCIGWYSEDFLQNIEGADDYLEIYFGTIEWIDLNHPGNGHHVHAAKMRVVDTLGNVSSLPGSSVMIFGEDGISCGEYLERFEVGSLYVIGLIKYGYQNQMQDTFHLQGCNKLFEKIDLSDPNGPTIEEIKIKVRTSISPIQDFMQADFHIYPNPVINFLTLESPFEGNQNIEIMDDTGRIILVMSGNIPNQAPLDVDKLSKGFYILRIRKEYQSRTATFIKSD